MKRLVLLLILLVWSARALAANPEDLSWTLDYGPSADWPAAIEELSARAKGIPGKAVASVLRRQAFISGQPRVIMVRALGNKGLTWDPRVLEFLRAEALGADTEAAQAAFDGLIDSYNPAIGPILEELRQRRPAWQGPIDRHLAEVHSKQERMVVKPQQWAEQRPALLGPAVLIAFALLSALLGLVLFVWGFRLLQLLRLLQRTAPAKVRSVAQGTALLRGRLIQIGEQLRHPVTEEGCLYYSGADRDFPYQQFYLEDETGRILVNPAGAVLISADGILTGGEEVMILGAVNRSSGTERNNLIGKPEVRRSRFDRCVHFLVQGVLGFWNRTGTGMALFSDPRSCIWIWDAPGKGPLNSRREAVRLLGIFLAAGVWISLFAATALVMFDQQFSAALASWLSLAG
jgi:hypothetical protein